MNLSVQTVEHTVKEIELTAEHCFTQAAEALGSSIEHAKQYVHGINVEVAREWRALGEAISAHQKPAATSGPAAVTNVVSPPA